MSLKEVMTKLKKRKFVKPSGKSPIPSHVHVLNATANQLTLTDLESTPIQTRDGLLAVDEASASVGFVISTPRRDRVGDVVIPDGCLDSLKDYSQNPVVFYAHNQKAPPIAFAKSPKGDLAMWFEPERIISRAYFHCQTQESEEIFRLVAKGILKAASIGFVPLEAEIIPSTNLEENLSEGKLVFDFGGFLFKKWQLLEWSVVPVPANPGALRSELENQRIKSPMLRKSLSVVASPKKAHLFLDKAMQKVVYKGLIDDLVAPPQQGFKPKPQDVDASGKPVDESNQPQAVIFSPIQYPSEDAVRNWLEENNLSADNLYAPTEDNEDYIAVQFPSEMCKPQSVKEQLVEEGVRIVFCEPTEENAEEEKPNPTEDPMKNNQKEERMNPMQGYKREEEVQEPLDEAPEDKKPSVTEEKKSKKPYGAEVLEQVCNEFDELCNYMEDAVASLEQPKVQKFLEKLQSKLVQLHDDTHNFGYATYPDHFEQGKPKETPEGEEMEEGKEDPGLEEKSAIASFLKEIQSVGGLSTSQRVACQHFAKVFSQFSQEEVVHEEPKKVEKTEEIPQEMLSSDLEKALTKQLEELSQQLFELTGKEF